ncbi:MAG: peptidoglycan editing factor PgeF [Candidatus Roizmanbacteria bacterium]|nr:peptidoglycan editing factor PgeF [Candidatus Roizmanbacteria bacterium]
MFQHYPDQNTISSSLFSLCTSGFTTKEAGDMRKIQIIKDFFQMGDIAPPKIVILEQIHSINIATPDPLHLGDVEILEEADGVVTKEKGALLVVRVADCVPILFYDPVAGVIGASHNGWRGSVKNMMKSMIAKMESLGAHAINIRIALGPAIGECCYTVDMDRYVLFMEEMERFEKRIFRPYGGAFRLNLTRLNYELAIENGIQKSHIEIFPFCTSCDSERFFSYRRQYKKHPEQFGEMMGYIMM